ncbi:MAG: hypothetical protein IKK68_05030 [Paludibacteraceae bacterium]|nr:hypothetical protein [Paludibacteraceae bacterium]
MTWGVETILKAMLGNIMTKKIKGVYNKCILNLTNSVLMVLLTLCTSCYDTKLDPSEEFIRYYKYQRETGETYLLAFVIFSEGRNEFSFYFIKENGKNLLKRQKIVCDKDCLYKYKEDTNKYELVLSISSDTTTTWCPPNAEDWLCYHFTFLGIEKIKLCDSNDSINAYKFIEELGNAPENVVSEIYFDDSFILLKRQYKYGDMAEFCMERISSVDQQFVNYVDSLVVEIKEKRKQMID